MKIFKYQLETTDLQQIEMPEGATILCIQTQNNVPCIWAMVNPINQNIKRSFEIFGTGHSIPNSGERKYIGTYQLSSGLLVFHCFELIKLK